MSKLSPVNTLIKNQGINVNPVSQKGLLKYAINKDPAASKKDDDDSESENDQDLSKFGSKKQQAAEKAARGKELDDLKAAGLDKIDESGAIRLPNRISKGVVFDPTTGTAKQGNDRDVMMSPSSFL